VTDFSTTLRHFCRNPRCRLKLPEPVSDAHAAFCSRGCYSSFFLHRCAVCEAPMERKNGNQKICRKALCKSALKANAGLGRYHTPKSGILIREVPDSIGSKWPLKPDRAPSRATLIRNAVQTEFFGGGQWREVVSPDGVRSYVTRLWGDEPKAEAVMLAA
jgi:hypothetical protein